MACGFFFKAIIVTSVKSLSHTPVSNRKIIVITQLVPYYMPNNPDDEPIVSKHVTILQKPELQVWNTTVAFDCVIYTSLTNCSLWRTVYFLVVYLITHLYLIPRLTISGSVLSLPLLLHSVNMENLAFSLPFYGFFRNEVCVNYTERINVECSVSNTQGMLWKVAVVGCLGLLQRL